ncbi:MAG: flippase-like domain-containing protein [Ignavibacteriae bacterium]|nr:flippase-like domain-containing protein [Ignavibacteriota bacterium]
MQNLQTNISQPTKQKSNFKLIAKIIIALALMYFLINYVHFDEIILALENANKEIIFVVFLLSFVNVYLQFLKWKVMCNSLLNIKNDNKIWYSLFYGFSGGIATPIRVGEYVGRAIPFENASLVKVTISTILEKFASLFLVLLLGGTAGIYFLDKYYSFIYAVPVVILVVGLGLIVVALIKGYNLISDFLKGLADRYSFFDKLLSELKLLKQLGKTSLNKLLFYSFLFYTVYILQYALLAMSFSDSGNLLYFIWAGTLVMFAKSFLSFISFADLGIRETASVFVLNKMGFAKAVGFNAAIFLFLFNLLIPSIIGLFLLFKKDKVE